MSRKHAIIVILLALSLGVISSTVNAQQIYTGYMADDVPDDRYLIQLEEGQIILVTAEADNSQLDTLIRLENPYGKIVIENDDRNSSVLDSLFSYEVRMSGQYNVVMSNYPGTSGNYRLIIEVQMSDAAVSIPTRSNESYNGYMGDAVPNNLYEVDLVIGQTVTINADTSSGNLDPYLILHDPNNIEVSRNDDRDDSTLNAQLIYTATASGTHTITMTNIQDTSGDYRLEIVIGETDANVTVSSDGADIADISAPGLNEEHSGYMGDDVNNDFYEVDLVTGQTVTINADATGGNLDTYLILHDPNNVEVSRNDDRDDNTLNSQLIYTATTSGTHTITMTNIQNTGGDYRLSISVGAGERGSVVVSGDAGTADAASREFNEEYSGYMGDDVNDDTYEVQLNADQAVIVAADAVGTGLDPYLVLSNERGAEVARNDDRDNTTLNSELVYIAPENGTYTITMTNIQGTSGDYHLTISLVPGDEAVFPVRIQMSGQTLFYDTPNFRIHYTLEGDDAATEEYVLQVAQTMEEVRTIQIEHLGWPAPPTDSAQGGNDLYDVYLTNLLGVDSDGGGAMGYTSPEWPAMDNPNTAFAEEDAAASYLVLDNDYSEDVMTKDATSLSLMRTTAAHEYNHSLQFGHDLGDKFAWYYEATASWMEIVTFPQDEAATHYIENIFDYPEICLGADPSADPTGGLLSYGSLLFIQSIVDIYDEQIPLTLWENIARYEGWQALEKTISPYGNTIPQVVSRYHIKNLLRDYYFAPQFAEYTVWLENTINLPGEWTFSGLGIQELAANYFKLDLEAGRSFQVTIRSQDDPLEMWAIAISGDTAEIIALGAGAAINTGNYDHLYLMVFNPQYDDDVSSCAYSNYTITVTPSTAQMGPPTYKLSAVNFEPLD